ncbi:MAG: aconitase X [Hyphomicrobiaceae bacterium]
MQDVPFGGRCLVPGLAAGPVLYADVPLSFMGGVDVRTGEVIDTHHPLRGQSVTGKVLVIPSGRGSCGGSASLFEMIYGGTAPAALVFKHKEPILALGSIIARELEQKSIPVVWLAESDHDTLARAAFALVEDGKVTAVSAMPALGSRVKSAAVALDLADVSLSSRDRRFLAGDFGEAGRVAMRIVIEAAQLEGATELIDIDMAHIDGCFYQGPGSLAFATKLADMGGAVQVPSTMNAICVDRRQWRQQGVPASMGTPSDALAEAYVRMGVQPTYTCAPYLLSPRPKAGQQIGWAESNAVVFANAVLGARTMKYPDYLDICLALTGRAPNADCHLDAPRLATLRIDVPVKGPLDDAYYATLGYHLGKIATNEIPVLCGLENSGATDDDLKAFGAAFATTSAAPMFHVAGVTPEAPTVAAAIDATRPLRHIVVTVEELAETWRELNSAATAEVGLVALGNPHFSLTECEALAKLCQGRTKAPGVALIVTLGREVYEAAKARGAVAEIERFGGSFVNDTCWCLIAEPVIPPGNGNIMTSSGKYAHYGTAAVGRGFHLRSLAECVDAACKGHASEAMPAWL